MVYSKGSAGCGGAGVGGGGGGDSLYKCIAYCDDEDGMILIAMVQ